MAQKQSGIKAPQSRGSLSLQGIVRGGVPRRKDGKPDERYKANTNQAAGGLVSRVGRDPETGLPLDYNERQELRAERKHESVPFVDWDTFKKNWKWERGEHVTLVGPTGRGKTTLALKILTKHPYTVAFGTKAVDEVLYPKLESMGFKKEVSWNPQPQIYPRMLLVPPLRDTSRDALKGQQVEFEKAINGIFRAGGYDVFMDEMRYLTHTLSLQENIELLYLQGRSLHVSMLGLTQRPVWIPLVALSQATHLFVWLTTDKQDIQRLAEASGVTAELVREVVPELDPHEVLYLNLVTGSALRTDTGA